MIAEICDYMLELGWGPYQNDHEDANGQFEMNWDFDDALSTADKHSFFKFMVKSVAENHGLRATFMPKPVEGLTGNGCHAHVSVWDMDGKTNIFATDKGEGPTGELGLSEQGKHFPRRDHEARKRLGGDHQPDRQQLQTDQRTPHTVRSILGAKHRHVDRQQQNTYGARPRARAVRTASRRWRGESIPVASGYHRGRAFRHSQQGRSGQTS